MSSVAGDLPACRLSMFNALYYALQYLLENRPMQEVVLFSWCCSNKVGSFEEFQIGKVKFGLGNATIMLYTIKRIKL